MDFGRKGCLRLEKVDDTAFPIIDGVPEGANGTCVILHLNNEDSEYATRWRIEEIIKTYSDHIAFPIYLHFTEKQYDDKGKVKSEASKTEQINDAGAIWQKPKSELKSYFNFYKSLSHDSQEPLLYVHTRRKELKNTQPSLCSVESSLRHVPCGL